MILILRYTNNLAVPVTLLNNQGTGQPLLPRQTLEMTFDADPDDNGMAELVLICEPNP